MVPARAARPDHCGPAPSTRHSLPVTRIWHSELLMPSHDMRSGRSHIPGSGGAGHESTYSDVDKLPPLGDLSSALPYQAMRGWQISMPVAHASALPSPDLGSWRAMDVPKTSHLVVSRVPTLTCTCLCGVTPKIDMHTARPLTCVSSLHTRTI